ncbi:MAG: metal-dependent transcriptional regulator [Deltaproteobacteria bacterium]|nr:metal-dependent transcriptional regulator [Deltaproteobacteria bacterium]
MSYIQGVQDNLLPSLRLSVGRGIEGCKSDQKVVGEEITQGTVPGLVRKKCEFEHILSPEVTESVCTFLGHPPTCPHGKPIPRGKCCEKFHKEMKPLVTPLNELQPGEEGRIVFIAPKNHTRLDRLSTMGIIPGSIVRLHQKRPSFVLEIGETTLALDGEIVKEIYVKRV